MCGCGRRYRCDNDKRSKGEENRMKLAVLSDIHGNYLAFRQCVEYALARGINTFIFLGDYTGELPYKADAYFMWSYPCTKRITFW